MDDARMSWWLKTKDKVNKINESPSPNKKDLFNFNDSILNYSLTNSMC